MNSVEIRQKFLDFFAAKGHTVVASSPLVPINDPTLMFTNSGMVQFKDVFLGADKRPYVRATSCQACLRAGGKHNDLENVGYTARHHTFFEMLGNWSFGDYFKRESLLWGWELLTQVYGLPPERLWATVYQEDDEAYDIWVKEIGLPPERVVRIGDNKGARYASDNFWMMADTGPCGPCSEVFYDHGPEIPGGPPGSPEADGDRFIEIWNHVFMQFDMQPDGSVKKLPAPCVDTGMGLERLAAILQGKHSNYEIDLFEKLIAAAAREVHCADLASPSLRVIADHIRACAFLIADGVIPGNEGRGYVLRRIIRRAIRHGYKLGARAAFFHRLMPDLVAEMGAAYPGLQGNAVKVAQTLQQEEERFFATIEHGMAILESELAKRPATLNGDTAFKLHDTYGFPLDLTQDVCREHGVAVDVAAFDAAMTRQKEQARAAGKFKMDAALDYSGPPTTFHGYDTLEHPATVQALYREGAPVAELQPGEAGVVVLDQTPFYAESGGQVGDRGLITAGAARLVVTDTQKIQAQVFGHHGVLQGASLKVGDAVLASVDTQARAHTMRHHSATHLMHKALREVLGTHVLQKGSAVTPEHTRFDFAHGAPLKPGEIEAVERLVNAQIMTNRASQVRVTSMDEAQRLGAVALFGEKYGDAVRVVDIGESRELCGGTHVARAGDIGFFKIVSEEAVAAGVRRVTAVCGEVALHHVQSQNQLLREVVHLTKSSEAELLHKLQSLQSSLQEAQRALAAQREQVLRAQALEFARAAVTVQGIKLARGVLEADTNLLRVAVDAAKVQLGSGVVVFASRQTDKVQVCVGVSKDLSREHDAGKIAQRLATALGGKGGGRAEMALAGGSHVEALEQVLAQLERYVFHVEPVV